MNILSKENLANLVMTFSSGEQVTNTRKRFVVTIPSNLEGCHYTLLAVSDLIGVEMSGISLTYKGKDSLILLDGCVLQKGGWIDEINLLLHEQYLTYKQKEALASLGTLQKLNIMPENIFNDIPGELKQVFTSNDNTCYFGNDYKI